MEDETLRRYRHVVFRRENVVESGAVAFDVPLHLFECGVFAVRVEIRLHRKRERGVVEVEPAVDALFVECLAAQKALVDVLNRLVHERAEHRGGLPVGRKAKVAVGHVLQGAVLVEQNIRGEGVGVLD